MGPGPAARSPGTTLPWTSSRPVSAAAGSSFRIVPRAGAAGSVTSTPLLRVSNSVSSGLAQQVGEDRDVDGLRRRPGAKVRLPEAAT